MKKWIGCMVMLLVLCASVTAGAEEVALGEGEYVQDIAAFGQEALVLGGGNGETFVRLYKDGTLTPVYAVEDEVLPSSYQALSDAEKQVWDQRITTLFEGDDGIYAYARYGRQLYRWDGAQLVKEGAPFEGEIFERSGENGRQDVRYIDSGCVVDGKLLVLFSGDESNNYCPIVYTFDLKTGEGRQLEVEGLDYVQSLSVYKDGQVLLCYQDPENDYRMSIRTLNMETGALGEAPLYVLDGYNASGMTYDAAGDTIYYFDQGRIYQCAPGEQSKIVAYPPTSYIGSGAALMNGKYVMALDASICAVAVDGSALPEQTLNIQGGYMDDVQKKFLAENPSVGIATVDAWYGSSQEIANAIKTGEKGIDIFNVSITNGLYAIINKGYALRLSDSDIIREATQAYYDGFASAVKDADGNVCAVYDSLYAENIMSVNTQLWEQLELGEYPTTYSELIDLIALWEDEYAEEYPDYTLFMVTDKRDIVNQVIRNYIAQYENAPGGLDFTHPALREVLEKIEALEMETIDWESMTEEDYEELNERYNRDEILSVGSSEWAEGVTNRMNHSGDIDSYTVHLLPPLVFEKDATPEILYSGSVLLVNPESPNKELAVKYLEYRVTHMEENTAYKLNPSLNEPVRVSNYERVVADMEKELERVQEALEKAEEVDKADYQSSIDYLTAWLADKDKNQWQISQEGIDRYREICQSVRVPSDSIFLTYDGDSTSSDQIYEMVSRYADGQLTLDAFLREMNQKAQMMQLEGR